MTPGIYRNKKGLVIRVDSALSLFDPSLGAKLVTGAILGKTYSGFTTLEMVEHMPIQALEFEPVEITC